MSDTVNIGPVARRDRIDAIDVMRGVAILGILHLNLPMSVNPASSVFADVRNIGWSSLDQMAWIMNEVFTKGTMRGMLQLLFGAGLMMLTVKAMKPDGPVAVADVWYRRNIWLMAFGAFNALVLMFPGDILFVYGAAAILLFPFRLMKAKWLLAIVGLFLAYTVVSGTMQYREGQAFVDEVTEARLAEGAGETLTEDQTKAIAEWDRRLEEQGRIPALEKSDAEMIKAHSDPVSYVARFSQEWWTLWGAGLQPVWIVWTFFAMLLGMALYKLGFIQGALSSRTYLAVMIGGYTLGWGIRLYAVQVPLTFEPYPDPERIFGDIPRLLISIGHIATINLLMRTKAAGALVATLGATGRVAFTVYLMQSFIMFYILVAPWGFGLYGNVGWFQILWMSAIIMFGQVLFAMWWTRHFRFGPLEWLWRSLVHWKRQPMRLSDGKEEKPPFGPQPTTA